MTSTLQPVLVRPAEPRDVAAITAIYNEGIRGRGATFETRERREEEVAPWLGNPAHPVLVAEREGRVLGWIAASGYRPRECYAGIAEFSVYVERESRGRGAGRLAMTELIDAAERAGFWKLVSRVFVENAPSRELLRSLGFREVGVYEKHGRLNGTWRDVVIVERLIPANLKG